MAQRLEQTQEAVQTQQLATLQVAVAKLVELPITELATRVRDEMLDNAALEEADPFDAAADTSNADYADHPEGEAPEADDYGDDDYRPEPDADDTLYDTPTDYGKEADAMGDYLGADDVPDYLQQRAEAESQERNFQYASTRSFYDELLTQAGESDLTEHELELMKYLIGSLDENGFLPKELYTLADELAIYHGINTSEAELERVLHVLQGFEPRGIGARSLQECLRLQLVHAEHRTPYTQLALSIVDRCFNDFAAKHWDAVKRRLHLSDEDFNQARNVLTHLNPRPGSALNDEVVVAAPTVVPDFFVQLLPDGTLQISLNSGDVPELRVSPAFRDSLKLYSRRKTNLSREQQDAYTYAKQKVESAASFINLLSRRRETLLSVMRAIVSKQHAFFENDDDEEALVPLTLKEIAEMAGVNISTVSRVTSSKYVQTLYGTYPLRFFFSSQFTTSDGDELSARKVKAALKDLIAAEDKKHPLSDDALAAKLKEQGFNVARRTVAKYRDLLGLPTARLRKE